MLGSTTCGTHPGAWLKAANLHYVLAVGFGLVLAHTTKFAPSLFADATSQRAVSNHALYMQVFKAKRVVAAQQGSRKFMQVVASLIAYLLVKLSHYQALLLSVLTIFLLAGQRALFNAQLFQVVGEKLSVLLILYFLKPCFVTQI